MWCSALSRGMLLFWGMCIDILYFFSAQVSVLLACMHLMLLSLNGKSQNSRQTP